jgi:hypothetical protein
MNARRRILTGLLVLSLTVGLSWNHVHAGSESPPAVEASTSVSETSATASVNAAPAWSKVELGVSRFLFLNGKLEMTRRQQAYDGTGPYAGRMLTLIKTESGLVVFGGNVGSVTTFSWIDPDTGSTVEFREVKDGKRVKQLLFREDGYQELQFRPEDGEQDTSPDTWPKTKDRFREYQLIDGSPVPEGQPVRDYYNMVADLGQREGVDGVAYYIATKGRVIRFDVVFGETMLRTLTLEDLGGAGEVSLELRLQRMDLTPWNEDPKDIGGFFAMEGGTEVWLEAETGLPAVIAGEMPGVPGRTEILLQGARFQGLDLNQALPPPTGSGSTASP